ncbi:hypothetical protein WA158_000333 [Blastocystis sp. Blastoise]
MYSYRQSINPWITEDYNKFVNNTFTASFGKDQYILHVDNSKNGSYWPTRDSCDFQGDPEGSCPPLNSISYENDASPLHTIQTFTLYDSQNKTVFARAIYPNLYHYYLDREIGCFLKPSLCISQCELYGGTWENGYCKVHEYIHSLCFRIIYENNNFKLDYDKYPGLGCEYGQLGLWEPYIYKSTPSSSIHIRIRYATDPYIEASRITKGCSSSTLYNLQCFGPTIYEQGFVEYQCYLIFAAFFIYEGIALYFSFLFCGKAWNTKKTETISVPLINTSDQLNTTWTFWFEERDSTVLAEDWGNQIQKIKDINTVQDFWNVYYNINQASTLAFQTMYHFFKEGISPIWEDHENQNGGSFRIPLNRYDSSDTEEKWLKLVLLAIGEQLDPTGSNICGVSFIMKKKDSSRLEIWTKDCTKKDVIASIGKRIRDYKLVTPETKIEIIRSINMKRYAWKSLPF